MITPTTPIRTKRVYTRLFCLLAGLLIISLGISSFFIFTYVDFAFAIPTFGFVLLVFSIFFGWLRRTTYLKFKNNALIVKGAFNKTLLTPLRTTDIEPVLRFSKFVILRVNFALDGIQHSYFTFTNLTRFQMMKKRQAISRVL